jgi:hypothetical protein
MEVTPMTEMMSRVDDTEALTPQLVWAVWMTS